MADTYDEVLQDEAIEKSEALPEGWRIWLKGIKQPVTIVLVVSPHGGHFYYLSHLIKTPDQMAPYHPDGRWEEGAPVYSLRKAVTALTLYYDLAVKDGKQPKDSWLVPNTYTWPVGG